MDWVPPIYGSGPVIAAIWAEDFYGFFRFPTREVARAWLRGYSFGGGRYGAGNCFGVLIPDEMGELEEEQKAEVRQHVLALKDVLKEARPALCTCSYDDSEEMTRHAPLCEFTKAGFNW